MPGQSLPAFADGIQAYSCPECGYACKVPAAEQGTGFFCPSCGSDRFANDESAADALIERARPARRSIGTCTDLGADFKCCYVITGRGTIYNPKFGRRPRVNLGEDLFLTLTERLAWRFKQELGEDPAAWIGQTVEITTERSWGRHPLQFAVKRLSTPVPF